MYIEEEKQAFNALKSDIGKAGRFLDRTILQPTIGKSSDTYREEAATFAATPTAFARANGPTVLAATNEAILDAEKATRLPRWATRGALGAATQIHAPHMLASPLTGVPLAATHAGIQGIATSATETMQRREMQRRMPYIPKSKQDTKTDLLLDMARRKTPLTATRQDNRGETYGLRAPRSRLSNEMLRIATT